MGFTMSKCRQCKIEILDETERCPLCGSVLEQTVEVENMYPNVRLKARKMMLFGRIYLFCAILTEALLVYLNVTLESKIWWSLITGLALFYGIILIDAGIILLMIVNHRNWQSYLMWQITMILFSLIPVFFAVFGIITEPLLSGLAMAFSVALFLGTVIIGDRRARVELKRRFHIR